MIKRADLHAVSKIFGQTTVGFSIFFGPFRTSFGGMTQPVVLFSLASFGFLRVSGTTRFVSRAGSGVFLHYFPSSFSISSTCRVGHLDLEILLSHISSNFCGVFCWTLHTNVKIFPMRSGERERCKQFSDERDVSNFAQSDKAVFNGKNLNFGR